MTIPFACLLVAVLIPYALSAIVGGYRSQQFGEIDIRHPREQQAKLEGRGARAQAAQENSREILPVFASAVFVSHLNGGDPRAAAALSIVFVATRVLHVVFYVGDQPKARAGVFIVGLVCCIALFFV